MRVEEAFNYINDVLRKYNPELADTNYLITEARQKDYMVTDITSRIAHRTGRNKSEIARYFVDHLPFSAIVNDDGELEFYL